MTLAPDLADYAGRDPAAAASVAAALVVDWQDYQQCKVCRARTGEACIALSGRVAGGRPDGVPVELPVAHAHRKRRAGR